MWRACAATCGSTRQVSTTISHGAARCNAGIRAQAVIAAQIDVEHHHMRLAFSRLHKRFDHRRRRPHTAHARQLGIDEAADANANADVVVDDENPHRAFDRHG